MLQNYFRVNKSPIFMPDATYGIVNSISMDDLKKCGTKALVTNTLHLYLNFLTDGFENPSAENLSEYSSKSFKQLTNWEGGVITDSGGFQAYSFIKRNLGKMHDDYLEFLSPKNKSKHYLTPEKSIEIQLCLRSDVIIVLDDPIDPDSELFRINESVNRTIAWAKRCKEYYSIRMSQINEIDNEYNPMIFCVIQGGANLQKRKECFDALLTIGIEDIYIAGGVASNSRIREIMDEKAKFHGLTYHSPIKELCTDNAAMIAGFGINLLR